MNKYLGYFFLGLLTCCTELALAADSIPFKATEEVSSSSYFSVFGALFIILALLYAGLWALKRYDLSGLFQSSTKQDQEITLLSSKLVSPKTRLLVIKYNNKKLLLAEHQNGVELLSSETLQDSRDETTD